MKNSLEDRKKDKLEEFKNREVIYDPVPEIEDEAIEDNKHSWEKFKKERKNLGGAFADLTNGFKKLETKEERENHEKALLKKMFEQYKEQEKERPVIEARVDKKKKKTREYRDRQEEIKNAHGLLNKAAEIYSEFEKEEEGAWYKDREWNKKLEEAQRLARVEKINARSARDKDIISEIEAVKEKLKNLDEEDRLNKKLEPFFEELANYDFLETQFRNEKGKEEFVVNGEYVENDYTKSIYFLGNYLPKKELLEIIKAKKGESKQDHLRREFYTFSNEDLEGEFGNKIVKIKKTNGGKNPVEEEITLRDLVALGQDRIGRAIFGIDQARFYMKRNEYKKRSPKIREFVYHNFAKIKVGDSRTVNQIPFDMSFVVARGYYGADSFATFDKKNGKIALVASPEIVNAIYLEIKEIIPDFPAPVGAKLLTPDDPKIIKQVRENISEEKWREILGIEKIQIQKAKNTTEQKLEEPENKFAHVNTDEGIEDEDSMPEHKVETENESKEENEEAVKVEEARSKILSKMEEEVKSDETEVVDEKNISEIEKEKMAKIEELEKVREKNLKNIQDLEDLIVGLNTYREKKPLWRRILRKIINF